MSERQRDEESDDDEGGTYDSYLDRALDLLDLFDLF